MNYAFATEVGPMRYVWRRCLWRLLQKCGGHPKDYLLPTGLRLPFPRGSFFASDVFVTRANVDWHAEHILARRLIEQGPEGDFLDVGAHIGYYSLLYAPLVRRVFAFEPDPRNHGAMAATASRADNLEVVPLAVADKDGPVGFCEGEASSVSHIAGEDAGQAATTVAATSLDSFVSRHGLRPLAVKIDIEGYDILALEGARQVAREHRPVFLVEFNLEEGRPNTLARLDAFLDEVDYVLHAIVRTEAGLFDCRYAFKEMRAADLAGCCIKMLFLAPREDPWFPRFARRMPHWSSRDLRPAGVARVLRGEW